jgi:hypothetical protein
MLNKANPHGKVETVGEPGGGNIESASACPTDAGDAGEYVLGLVAGLGKGVNSI